MAIIFKEEDVRICLDKALEIREVYTQYVLQGDHYPKSVDDLLWVCQQYLGKTITVEYVDIPVEGSSIKAAYWALEDGTYFIGVLTGMTQEELRYVLCKELFHVIFDDETRRSLALFEHVEEYTSTLPMEAGEPNCPAAWESLAEIAATEFLLPYERRKEAVNGGGPADFARLATMYGMPRLNVEIACGPGNLSYIGKRIQPT